MIIRQAINLNNNTSETFFKIQASLQLIINFRQTETILNWFNRKSDYILKYKGQILFQNYFFLLFRLLLIRIVNQEQHYIECISTNSNDNNTKMNTIKKIITDL